MASATKETKITVPEVSEETIVLTLSKDEAQLLRDILGRSVYGPLGFGSSRRRFSNSIYSALATFLPEPSGIDDYEGLITFTK